MSAALQIWVTASPSGQVHFTVQPFVGLVPVFVTVKPSWKPPLHEFVIDQEAEQAGLAPPVAVPVPVGVPVAVAVELGVPEAEADGDADTDAEAVGEADADAVGVPVGSLPVPPLSTTIDSAGTEIDEPLNALLVIVGSAASYTYWVVEPPVRPVCAVGIV